MSPGHPVRLKFFIICQIVELAKKREAYFRELNSMKGKSRGLTPANKDVVKWHRILHNDFK